jgi:hypothetical protein
MTSVVRPGQVSLSGRTRRTVTSAARSPPGSVIRSRYGLRLGVRRIRHSGALLDTPRIVDLRSDSPEIERSSRLDPVPDCGRIADAAAQ